MSQRNTLRTAGLPGFTLIELLVVISIIGVLVAILLPALAKAKAATHLMQCGSNCRQILVGTTAYAQDYRQALPVAKNFSWEGWGPLGSALFIQDALVPYLSGQVGSGQFSPVFHCPAVQNGASQAWIQDVNSNCYRYSVQKTIVDNRSRKLDEVLIPSQAVLYYDVVFPDWPASDFAHDKAGTGVNVGYVDGHADDVRVQTYLDESPNSGAEHLNVFVYRGWP
ncbi:MAG: prepilin-type N-terminal cleavage/methylation domain-containing protein [Phycisphaeraceae bacterium]|nr:prepilin-type N-terminal cleavage/methylation domain-containing protein [Phycisphaeraceae bacterium]